MKPRRPPRAPVGRHPGAQPAATLAPRAAVPAAGAIQGCARSLLGSVRARARRCAGRELPDWWPDLARAGQLVVVWATAGDVGSDLLATTAKAFAGREALMVVSLSDEATPAGVATHVGGLDPAAFDLLLAWADVMVVDGGCAARQALRRGVPVVLAGYGEDGDVPGAGSGSASVIDLGPRRPCPVDVLAAVERLRDRSDAVSRWGR